MVKRTISSIMWLVYWIPEPIYKAMAWLLARIFYWSDNKTARSIYTNLLLCFPGTTKARRKQIALNYLTNNFYMSKEATYAWLGNREFIQSKFTKVDAGPIAELSGKQPIIIAVPHIGNWEFFWHWLQPNFDAISMYSPAKFKPLDQIILKARKQFGGKPFDTSSKGMIRLLKALKNNGIMMILPDQAPRLGAGIYTPFFGHPAYTMTLLHKFINKTDATLLFGYCLRSDHQAGFEISIEQAEFGYKDVIVEEFNHRLNHRLEKL